MSLEPAIATRTKSSAIHLPTVLLTVAMCAVAPMIRAEDTPARIARQPNATALAALSGALRELSQRVAPAVVQVRASGYSGTTATDPDAQSLVLEPRENIGSGVIVDASGLVLTNAHVIEGADRLDVEVASGVRARDGRSQQVALAARVVGIAKDLDVALLKVDPHDRLTPIQLGDSTVLRQGDIVFAFGNPAGLGNSMTMGVVSAVARQLDEDSPSTYIQTDATINPGDSGGPLVNADGELVGLNTLIVSASGGSQGLGFAIPANVLGSVYPQLRDHGSLPRTTVGIQVQAITPSLAKHLQLARNSGVLVSDVTPTGPARMAGVQVQDILLAVNGVPTPDVPSLALSILSGAPGESLTLTLLRGRSELSTTIVAAERGRDDDSADTLTPGERQPIPRLGILAGSIEATTARVLSHQRIDSGVLVVARDGRAGGGDVVLVAGDIIHAVDGIAVSSIDTLNVLVDSAARGSRMVLQVERQGHLRYVVQTVY